LQPANTVTNSSVLLKDSALAPWLKLWHISMSATWNTTWQSAAHVRKFLQCVSTAKHNHVTEKNPAALCPNDRVYAKHRNYLYTPDKNNTPEPSYSRGGETKIQVYVWQNKVTKPVW